jgi:hypothetical protein
MNEHFDPQTTYDLVDPEGFKMGEVRQGLYYEGTWKVGEIEGDVFHYNGVPAGKVEGLTVTRDDPPGAALTVCRLVPQKSA